MTVIAHPASKPHFDNLLHEELKVTHDMMISWMPILQNLLAFSEAIRIGGTDGFELPLDALRTLNASFETLAKTLAERNEQINYYKQMSSFGGEV